jgi:hypothetical protein
MGLPGKCRPIFIYRAHFSFRLWSKSPLIAITSISHAQNFPRRDCLFIDHQCFNQFGRVCLSNSLNVSMEYYRSIGQEWDGLSSQIVRFRHSPDDQLLAFLLHGIKTARILSVICGAFEQSKKLAK